MCTGTKVKLLVAAAFLLTIVDMAPCNLYAISILMIAAFVGLDSGFWD